MAYLYDTGSLYDTDLSYDGWPLYDTGAPTGITRTGQRLFDLLPEYVREADSRDELLRYMAAIGDAAHPVAKALDTHPSNMTRDLYNLQEAGFAERIGDSDLWRLSPKFVQIAVSFFNQMDSAQSRIDEVKQRYTRDR